MALMAVVDVFGRDDLAARVIPSMSITLVDKEKRVRDQAFKAIDMFVKRAETLASSMVSLTSAEIVVLLKADLSAGHCRVTCHSKWRACKRSCT